MDYDPFEPVHANEKPLFARDLQVARTVLHETMPWDDETGVAAPRRRRRAGFPMISRFHDDLGAERRLSCS